jgi:hypothetical protein
VTSGVWSDRAGRRQVFVTGSGVVDARGRVDLRDLADLVRGIDRCG